MGKVVFDVAYSGGRHPVTIGDTVRLVGIDWRIGGRDGNFYSPTGLGGTPCFRLHPLAAVPPVLAQYVEEDGAVVFCGDTIAAQLARGNPDW